MKTMMRLLCSTVATAALAIGCAAERHAEIPTSAQMVAEGTHKITFEAPRDGMAWVYNAGNGNMEYAGRLNRGDMLVVDPDRDKISLNGRDVNDKPLTTLDQKKIFFESTGPVTATERRISTYEERQMSR